MRTMWFLSALLLGSVFVFAGHPTMFSGHRLDSEAAVSDADGSFMMEAASGGLAEVEMGRLAAKRGSSADIREFAQRMVHDHNQANFDLMRLANRKTVTLPTELTDHQQRDREKLAQLSGAEFDQQYMRTTVADHDKDVKTFAEKAGNADDPNLKEFVLKTLPTLKKEQQMANEIRARQVSVSK